MNFEEKLEKLTSYTRAIAGRVRGLSEGLESAESSGNEMLEWVRNAEGIDDEERDLAARAATKLGRGETLHRNEADVAEAIILPTGRPVLDVIDGSFRRPPAPWSHLDRNEFRKNIEAAIPSVGRIEVPDHPSIPYAGTGFVVGEGLLMTNRHVAEIFVLGLGIRNLRFKSGMDVEVDFRREGGSPAQDPFEVREVLLVHPYWDMALLRVDGLSRTRTPLRLEAAPADDLRGSEVAVIGYPAEDFRNDHDLQQRIFRGKFRIKRMQPGKITGTRRADSFGHHVQAMTHDSSTLGGNSGSAIVNVKTGHVLGLHFGGVYLSANYAVPSYELSRDPFVIGKRVQFTRENVGVLPWKSFWDQTATESKPAVAKVDGTAQAPQTSGSSVTITIPLQITVSLGAIDGGGRSIQLPVAKPATDDADDALADALAAEALPYYDAAADAADRDSYYQEIDSDTVTFEELTELLVSTHTASPAYKPSRWVYPVVDRQKNKKIRSLYSVNGTSYTFQEMIALDEKVAAAREERIASTQESLEDVEAALPFNCEHVVPQSWFNAKEPMRGDIHHLFGCESGCNSFRGNRAFFAFDEEAVRQDCGQSDSNKFEPGAGKGAVARATFYFLVRHAKKVRTANMPAPRLAVLKEWHAADPVSEWEKHRNRAIFKIQGNRNPFIDFPELGDRLDLKKGLRTGAGESVAESESESYGEALRRE